MAVKTLFSKLEVIQGDSTDPVTFASPDFSDIAWDSSVTIRENTVNGAIALTIPLVKTNADSAFEFFIGPVTSEGSAVGTYFLSIEIRNLDAQFRREVVQSSFIVHPSGVLNA